MCIDTNSVLESRPGECVANVGFLQEKFDKYFNDDLNFFDNAIKIASDVVVQSIKKLDEGDLYSYKWTGTIYPPVDGDYSFIIRRDDRALFYIDDVLVMDGGRVQSAAVPLLSDQTYRVSFYYGEDIFGAEIQLFWKGPWSKLQTDFTPLFKVSYLTSSSACVCTSRGGW